MHPILFHIYSVPFYSYGFFVALAVIAVFFLSMKRAKSLGYSQTLIADLIFLMFVSGVIGARLFFVLQHFENYRDNFRGVFFIQEGGLVWYGGFFGAVFSGILVARLRRWPFLKLCDFFAPVLPVAQAIGRIGCFFNGCCYGKNAFPIQLLEASALLAMALLLLFLSRKNRPDGTLFMNYVVLYSGVRFLDEFLRGDQKHFGLLTLPQWMSLVLFGVGLFLVFFLGRERRVRK